ncbi:MAG TPA: 2-succinyl-5-enolpyruvyl-6-hydroxy-3-cyclohexene-1-carboxylic-acid synthase [Acidimicrobiia bacterium]|nr:2-succinyl-5-enolpyruvyl-6-hydroxy-3-cyclohexene-1-carboxylic-acid synthase [Acidimicrobiia bacterium]
MVVDELSVAGVRFLAIAPGSRSAALAIAADEHPDLATRVFIDERSAAFHAMGVARASDRPAGVIATSGTAPANFMPAVVEADMACVPLVVVSADRPAEMQGVGANQTIDQAELFGSKVRAYSGIEAPGVDRDRNEEWRTAVGSLMANATATRPGPVHLNVAFREPTVPVTYDGRTRGDVYPFPTPRVDTVASSEDVGAVPFPGLRAERGVVIAGDGDYSRDALIEAAEDVGWPVLATALSGLRGREVISSYHFLLAGGVPDGLQPATVVAIGAIGPDPLLERMIAEATVRVRIDGWGRIIDPGRNATNIVMGDAVRLIEGVEGSAEKEWREDWLRRDIEIRDRVWADLAYGQSLSGAAIARTLDLVDWGALVVGSSLPIREVDAHLSRSGPVFANRGASGIDGFVSTALGVASVVPGTVAFCGDLSFLHDSNGFLNDGSIDLTLVVADNHGGGLFDSLPQARHAPSYERLFVTDPHRDLAALARFHGARPVAVDNAEDLKEAVDRGLRSSGVDVVLANVDREHDLEIRSRSYV